MNSGDKFSAFQSTDEQGHFSIENIPVGVYSLDVSRKGFVDNEYGQRRPGAQGAVLTLSAGQKMTDLVFKMIRTASISGHVYTAARSVARKMSITRENEEKA